VVLFQPFISRCTINSNTAVERARVYVLKRGLARNKLVEYGQIFHPEIDEKKTGE
jgi:hypothetical protein